MIAAMGFSERNEAFETEFEVGEVETSCQEIILILSFPNFSSSFSDFLSDNSMEKSKLSQIKDCGRLAKQIPNKISHINILFRGMFILLSTT